MKKTITIEELKASKEEKDIFIRHILKNKYLPDKIKSNIMSNIYFHNWHSINNIKEGLTANIVWNDYVKVGVIAICINSFCFRCQKLMSFDGMCKIPHRKGLYDTYRISLKDKMNHLMYMNLYIDEKDFIIKEKGKKTLLKDIQYAKSKKGLK